MKKTISVFLYTAAVVLVVCGVSCKSAQNAQQKSPVESMPSEPSVQEAEQTPMNTAAAHESTAPNTMTGAASDTLADPLHTAEANTASMNEPVTEQNIAEQQNSGDTADVKTADAEPSVELVPHAQPAESTAASPAQQTDNTAVQPSAVQPANTPSARNRQSTGTGSAPSARTAQTGAASGSHNVPTKPDARQQANQSLPKNRQSSAAATAATSPAQSSSRSSPATTAPAERRSAQAGAPQTNRSASSRTENGAGSAAAKAAANASSQLAQQDAQKSTQSESADGKADESGPVSEQNEPVIIPSRSVSAKINQFIDIVYPGKGWIYLGEVKAVKPPVISFSKRVRDNENTLFSLQAKRAGTTLLHFYKQDPLAASYLDDYVEVNVLNERGTARDHIRLEAHPLPDATSVQPSENNENANRQSAQAGASGQNGTPSGAEAIAGGNGTTSGINGSAASAGTTGKGTQNKNAGETETAIEAVLDADALFEKAQTAYNEKRYADALQALDEYFKIAEKNIDRALFLQGKIYESNSEFKNIRKALAVYEKLSAAFPESDLWESARKRVIYIKRFYLDIR
ncbi:MAG: hypothetical protein ACFNX1_00245 [Treponema lecithinolyticum]|uniref:hypothetical protein n=1 Tax=Treponema lecithinolyticum TaxID=53418 RepID=UPI0036111EB2